jgi:hypothetical protein
MRQTAPGRYEAEFPLDGYGAFLLQAEQFRTGEDGQPRPVGVSYAEIANPYPLEYASLEPDVDKLARLAAATGGAVDTEPAKIFAPGSEKITYREPLFGKSLMVALGLFVLDLLVRRVRLFDRKFIARPRRAAAR